MAARAPGVAQTPASPSGARPASSAAGRSSRRPWILAGRYRMDEAIGHGGMSTVYRATDTVLDRPVAVKVLLAALAESDPTHIERFKREARAVAALHHPAVVKIYDTGVDEGRHFLVMEYVDGRGLDEALRDGRALEAADAVRIAARVADALAAAHDAGILHRDVKPANVMLAADGEVKVLDFGIARPLQEATLTQAASAMGTAAYMAPERIRGEPGDERSDVYALGCLLYAMLTGHPPFVADDKIAVLHQQLHAEPLPLSGHGVRVAPGLELLIITMLAKDPAARPQTAATVAARLRESLVGGFAETAAARPQMLTGARPGGVSMGGRDRRRLMPLVLLAGLVALVVAIAALASGGGGKATRFGAASKVTHRATGSYHEPVIQTTSQSTTAAATTPAPPAPKDKPPHAGRGPTGAGPPGQQGKPPGHDGKPKGDKGKPKGEKKSH